MDIAVHPGHHFRVGEPTSTVVSIDTDCKDQQPVLSGEWESPSVNASPPLNLKKCSAPINLSIDQIYILWQLDKGTVERIATDPSTPVAVLERLVAHPYSDVRAAVSDNGSTPMRTIWALSKDGDPNVRYQLAENHTLPLALISSLTNDDNPYVACRALKTYNRLKAG